MHLFIYVHTYVCIRGDCRVSITINRHREMNSDRHANLLSIYYKTFGEISDFQIQFRSASCITKNDFFIHLLFNRKIIQMYNNQIYKITHTYIGYPGKIAHNYGNNSGLKKKETKLYKHYKSFPSYSHFYI